MGALISWTFLHIVVSLYILHRFFVFLFVFSFVFNDQRSFSLLSLSATLVVYVENGFSSRSPLWNPRLSRRDTFNLSYRSSGPISYHYPPSSNRTNVKSGVSALSSTSTAFGTAASNNRLDHTGNGHIDEALRQQALAEEEAAMNQYKVSQKRFPSSTVLSCIRIEMVFS